ncbi:hypothetical protein Golomagni_04061 [Golovinomyces magnicellulatus]|nr:hypothetical protein Golomagni_04061 [Golovinomyces magnicellulatus]
MSSISWGSTLAVYTNIAVIGITYSCIAPLTLGFAVGTMFISYWVLRYHVIYVNDSPIDTKGLIYPRALQQLLTGVYLAEICLIGLFSLAYAFGPIAIMVIYLIFTLLYHRCLNTALEPLYKNLPKTLIAREEAINAERFVIESGENGASHETISENVADPRSNMKPSLLARFLAPHIYDNYKTCREVISKIVHDRNNLSEFSDEDEAYLPSSVKSRPPFLWIPRDDIGISAEEVAETGKIIPITDEGATISDDNKIIWDLKGTSPPIWRHSVKY